MSRGTEENIPVAKLQLHVVAAGKRIRELYEPSFLAVANV